MTIIEIADYAKQNGLTFEHAERALSSVHIDAFPAEELEEDDEIILDVGNITGSKLAVRTTHGYFQSLINLFIEEIETGEIENPNEYFTIIKERAVSSFNIINLIEEIEKDGTKGVLATVSIGDETFLINSSSEKFKEIEQESFDCGVDACAFSAALDVTNGKMPLVPLYKNPMTTH